MHCSWVNLFVAIIVDFDRTRVTHIVCDLVKKKDIFRLCFQITLQKQNKIERIKIKSCLSTENEKLFVEQVEDRLFIYFGYGPLPFNLHLNQ